MGGTFDEFSPNNSSYQGVQGPIVEVIGQEIRTSCSQKCTWRGPTRYTLTILPPHRLRLLLKSHEKLFCWSNGAEVHRASILSVPDYRSTLPTDFRLSKSFSKIFGLPPPYVQATPPKMIEGVEFSYFSSSSRSSLKNGIFITRFFLFTQSFFFCFNY